MTTHAKYGLVLAVYPNTRGYAFVVFESALSVVDWGAVHVRGAGKNKQCLRRIGALLGRYELCALVLQDMSPHGTSRAGRIRRLNEDIALLGETQAIPVFLFSRADVRRHFSYLGAPIKHAIAEAIAKHIPVFERFIPRVRKIWMSEDARMGIFDAAALALTFFSTPSTSCAN